MSADFKAPEAEARVRAESHALPATEWVMSGTWTSSQDSRVLLLLQHGCAGDVWCDDTPLLAFTVSGDQVTARFPDGEQRVGRICSPGGIRGLLAVFWDDGSCWAQRA